MPARLVCWASTDSPCGGEHNVAATKEGLDVTPVAPPARRTRRGRSVAVLGGITIIVGVLISQGLVHSLNFFVTVDEVSAQRVTLGTSKVNLEGKVVPGSIQRSALGSAFVMAGNGKYRVDVSAIGQPPQLFGPNIPVVVVGHFLTPTSTQFVATQIIVKHTATYIAQHPNRVTAPNGTKR